MKKLKNIFTAATYLVVILTLQACMAGTQLITRQADPSEIKGTYTVILYGCRYPDDIENMAILVEEGSGYPFEVYAIDSMYKVKNGLSAPQALAEAETFITCSFHTLYQQQLRKIPDSGGKTIGYELKPLYLPWDIGISEVLLSSYSLKNGKVFVYIRLDPLLEKLRDSGGNSFDSSGAN
jgi:hypothetical protein